MTEESAKSSLRALPSVEELLQSEELSSVVGEFSQSLTASLCREVLANFREKIQRAGQKISKEEILSEVLARMESLFTNRLQPVINATGIILHTNLGRAPLSSEIVKHLSQVETSYNNLEFVLEKGERGKRGELAEKLLCQLVDAEGVCLASNNAGAMFLALSALAKGKEVIVSRGELVQIGGGFKIPEILAESGAILKEVGTTNRTTISDYEDAITENTALLLKVHHSNFKMEGFVKEASLSELSLLAKDKNLPLLYDQGSGAVIDSRQFGLAKEPMVQEALSSGCNLVAFSGDKLLGGPQAGIIVGQAALITRLKSHPLYRAFRVGKFTIAGLEETVLHYLKGEATRKIPLWRMVSTPVSEIKNRAEAIVRKVNSPKVIAIPAVSYLGGGSLPEQELPSYAVAISSVVPLEDLARRFRRAQPPVIGRISQEKILLDLRTVFPEQDSALASIISSLVN